ncbi:MAG TPA: PorP/SprF family type IX secretion system membrane protein, partial [Chitinophaga sp.]
GIDTGLHVNVAYRRQWNGIEGAPVTKYLTADYKATDRVGIGFHLMSDNAGLIDRTRAALSYAYRLPLGQQGAQLSFGLSLALDLQHLDVTKLEADPDDPSIGMYNRRDNYFEGEFGMAYTHGRLTVQAALPNVRSLFTGDEKTVDGGSLYYTAVAYKFEWESAISSVAPKLAYRGVRGYDAIFDAGLNIGLLHGVGNVMALYHTSKSVTAGVGVNILKTVAFQALYTSQTGGIKTYVDGTFEVGLTMNLFK